MQLTYNYVFPMKYSLFLLVAVCAASTWATSPLCTVGAALCLKSQGTQIPSKQVIAILDSCADFTTDDLGRIALTLSRKKIIDDSGGKITPLVRAWYAFGDLHDSPLAFERKAKAEDTNYAEIKRS